MLNATKFLAAVILATFFAMTCIPTSAKPYLPRDEELPGRIRSLAGLETVRLKMKLPGAVLEFGVTYEHVSVRCASKIAPIKIHIVEDEEAPEMHVRVYHVDDPGVPRAFAFGIRISIMQDVVLTRLDDSIRIETFYT